LVENNKRGDFLKECEALLAPIEIDPKTFLRDHCSLPALPAVVGNIQVLVQDHNVDMDEIADVIGTDPAVLAQILKVVNSAYYGLPTEITKVRMAVAFLGLNEVYRIVLSLSVVNNLAVKEKDALDAFWFHSFFSATCAKHLAKKHEPLLSYEELWPAAILHDIGKLVYLRFYPDHYAALVNHCKENGCTFSEAEAHFQYPSSAYMGTLLCKHWRLPIQVKEACNFHTLDDLVASRKGDAPSPFQRIICLANLVALLSTDTLNQQARESIADAVKTDLNLDEEGFLTMMGDVYELKTEVESFVDQFL
jgi:HD-like signal output (HDOD) protein